MLLLPVLRLFEVAVPLPLLQVSQVEVPVNQLCQVVVLLLAVSLQRHSLVALSSLVKQDARLVDLSVPSPLVSGPAYLIECLDSILRESY